MEEPENPKPPRAVRAPRTPKTPAPSKSPKVETRGGVRANSGRKPRAIEKAEREARVEAQAAIDRAAAIAVAPAAAEIEAQRDRVIEEIPLALAVTKARKRIGDRYPFILEQLFALVEGATQVTRKWELAKIIMVEEWRDPDDKGKQVKTKKQLFPNAKDDAMVLVMEQRVEYPPDAATAQFLYNRLSGRPSEEKTNPLDEDGAGSTEAQSREEMFMDFVEMMTEMVRARVQGGAAQTQGAPPLVQPAAALAAPIETPQADTQENAS